LLATQVGMVRLVGNGWIDAAIMILITYVATWLLATLSYNTIEEPFLRMRRHYGKDKSTRIGEIATTQ
jgi:peptidoglycan/LPS O-acetylase OafA/YrhL